MKTLLNTLLFAAMTMPAVAQRYDTAQLPTADYSSPKDPLIKPEPQKPIIIRPAQVEEPAEPKEDAKAERTGPVADAQLNVQFWGVRDESLMLKAEVNDQSKKVLCLVLASVEDTMMHFPGLPPLLMTDTIVASGLNVGAFAFDMGAAKLPFTVFAQAVVTDGTRIGASGVLKIEPAQ